MSKKPEKETSSVEKLKEALFIDKKSGAAKISDSELKKADAFCEPYKKFLNKCKTERELRLSLRRGGESYEVELVKPQYAEIGLEFATYLMDQQRSCRNKCIFCLSTSCPQACGRPCTLRTTTTGFPSCLAITSP